MPDSDETDESSPPFLHVDYRIFEVTIEGREDDTLEDLNDIMNDRITQAMTDIEALKRTDFELDEEYEPEDSSGAPMNY